MDRREARLARSISEQDYMRDLVKFYIEEGFFNEELEIAEIIDKMGNYYSDIGEFADAVTLWDSAVDTRFLIEVIEALIKENKKLQRNTKNAGK